MKIKTTENEVTSAIIDGLNAHGYKVWKAFAGTAPIFHKGQMVFRRQKPGLQTKGMSDLIAIKEKVLFIEVKSSNGRTSPEQAEFISLVNSISTDIIGVVANSWEDVEKYI